MEGLKRQDSENLILLQVFELVWLCSLTWSCGNCCILVGERSQERLQREFGAMCEFSCMCACCKIPVSRRNLLTGEIFSW